jgi:hypothetical protein
LPAKFSRETGTLEDTDESLPCDNFHGIDRLLVGSTALSTRLDHAHAGSIAGAVPTIAVIGSRD